MNTTSSTSKQKLKILLIEDNEGDAALVREVFIARATDTFELEVVSLLKAGLERLAHGGIDAVVLDPGLPEQPGSEKRVTAARTGAPGALCRPLGDG